MGADISGGMIVGAKASHVEGSVTIEIDDCTMYGNTSNYHEGFYEWYESEGMETYSLYYDADTSEQIVGYPVKDVDPLSEEFDSWSKDVIKKAEKFYEMTGIKAELISMQNVW